MADKDINIHVNARAGQAQQALKETADAVKQVGDSTEQTGASVREGTQATDQLGTAAENTKGKVSELGSQLSSYATRAVGVVAAIKLVTDAINAQTEAMRENAQVINDQQNSLLRLQFLGDFFQEKPELRKEVAAMAEFGRRPFEEVANAWYNLRSKNAALPQQQQESILKEALEMGRTDPGLPLDTLVDMFSLYAKKSGTSDANRVQNILQQTITEAGGSGADVATYMPRFLPIGMAGGLTGSQAAGLWAYATTQEGEASVATTGLRALFMGLEGKGTPEGAKLLNEFGVDTQADFFTKIQQLSAARASGKLGLAEAEQIAQREGASMLLSILNDPQGLMRTIGNVTAVDRSDIDLTRNKIEGLFSADPIAQKEEEARLLEIRLNNIRASDVNSQEAQRALKEREAMWRELGVPELMIKANLRAAELSMAAGVSPEFAFSSPVEHWMLQRQGLPSEVGGYSSQAVQQTVINNNHNVIYNAPPQPSRPRSAPEDLN